MNADEIRSLRTALRYLRRGDDPARRRRLATILAAMYLPWIIAALAVAIAVGWLS